MSNINKQELRRTSDRDWFENWFKREFHPDKTGPYIKDQLFFAVRAAIAPLLDELEAKDRRNAELTEFLAHVKKCLARNGEYAPLSHEEIDTLLGIRVGGIKGD